MYYQKESKHANNDYYNSYVRTRDIDTGDILVTIIKILVIVFLLTLIIFGYIFVSNQYYISQIQAQKIKNIESKQEILVGLNSIDSVASVINKQDAKLSSEDITQIVKMVMLKMNSQKISTINGSSDVKALKEKDKIDTKLVIKTEDKNKGYPSSLSDKKKDMRIIIVKNGDTLSTIANKAYGDVHAYKKIYEANPEVIKNQDKIFTGQKIRIPE